MAAFRPLLGRVNIDIYTDVICPWCYVGKRRLELALETVPVTDLSVRYLPFELNPTTPAAGVNRVQYLQEKYGDGVNENDVRISALGHEIGLDFHFEKAVTIPNTHNSHRVIWLAGQEAPGLQKAVVEALHQAYFTLGQDLGDKNTLVATAAAAGLDAAKVAALLASEAGSEEVRALEEKGIDLGITGVPFFVFNNESALSGAQSVETFISALQELAG
jgi:predicted DsbA family dithiol-disulfide isomerase